jgi:hypothetical protein
MFPARQESFLFCRTSRPDPTTTNPAIRRLPRAFSAEVEGRRVKLTTGFHPVPRLRMSGVKTPTSLASLSL